MSDRPDPVKRIPANPTEAYRAGHSDAWDSVPSWCHYPFWRFLLWASLWMHLLIDGLKLTGGWLR